MFRTLNQTITAAKLWRRAFRKILSIYELRDYSNVILAHFGASAVAADERSSLNANMQYLRMLDSSATSEGINALEADRRRYYEFASEMASLDYFHFSSLSYTEEESAGLELCIVRA